MAEFRLGGINLYAKDVSIIESAIQSTFIELDRILQNNICSDVMGLRKKVITSIDSDNPERVLSAIWGRYLGLGRCASFICSGTAGGIYRAYFWPEERAKVLTALAVGLMLAGSGRATIGEFEKRVFGRRRDGTWSQISILVDRLVFLDLAVRLDRFSFQISEPVKYAAHVLHEPNIRVFTERLASDLGTRH